MRAKMRKKTIWRRRSIECSRFQIANILKKNVSVVMKQAAKVK